MNTKTKRLWALGLGIVFFDMVTKGLAQLYCMQEVVINKYLSFLCIKNYGISFGLFATHNYFTHMLMTLFIGVCFIFFAQYTYRRINEGKSTFAEICISAGGLSNFYDRIFFGAVIDFIKIGHGHWSFPIFNIADIAISLGVFLILYQVVRGTYEYEE